MNDSVGAIYEGITTGSVALDSPRRAVDDPATEFVRQAHQIIAALRSRDRRFGHVVSIGGRHLDDDKMVIVGTIEFAVHGWDVAKTGGFYSPIPAIAGQYVRQMLPVVIDDQVGDDRFASP